MGTYPQLTIVSNACCHPPLESERPRSGGADRARRGLAPLSFASRPFETLVRSIVFQQLSGKVARVIYGRLAAALPDGQ